MLVPIKTIKVKKRVRKDLGDIESLMESLSKYGLLTPVAINKKHELIAGGRRLEAAKRLGWEQIEVVVINKTDKLSLLEMELEENIQRSDFTDVELANGYAKLEKLRNPNIFKRMLAGLKRVVSYISLSDSESTVEQKHKRAKRFLLFIPAAVLLAVGGAVLASKGMITPVLHWFTDVISVAMLALGVFGAIKLFLFRK